MCRVVFFGSLNLGGSHLWPVWLWIIVSRDGNEKIVLTFVEKFADKFNDLASLQLPSFPLQNSSNALLFEEVVLNGYAIINNFL